MSNLSELGKGLFGRLGVKERVDTSIYGEKGTIIANGLLDLEKSLKYGDKNKIVYSNNGSTFVIGEDPIPTRIGDEEAENILATMLDYAPAGLMKKFYQAQEKSDVVAGDTPKGDMANDRGYGIIRDLIGTEKVKSGEINSVRGMLSKMDNYVEIDGNMIPWSDILAENGIELTGKGGGNKGVLKLDGKRIGYVGNSKLFVAPENQEYALNFMERLMDLYDEYGDSMNPTLRNALGHYLERSPIVVDNSSDALDSVKLKLLEYFPHANVCDSKWLGIFPETRVMPNAKIEELRKVLGNYSSADIESALKYMEGNGISKKKVGALRRLLNDKDGLNKKPIALAAILLTAFAGTAAAIYANNHNGNGSHVEDPVQNTTEPEIPSQNTTQPEIPTQNTTTTEPEIPIQNTTTTEPEIPIQNTTQPEIPIQNTTEPEIPVQNNTEPEMTPLEADLYDSSDLFRRIHSADKETVQRILDVATVNSSLAKIILNQIEKDSRVTDEVGLAREAFKVYINYASQIQQLSQIHNLNNATSYFKTANALSNAISAYTLDAVLGILAKNGVYSNFDNAREHANLLRLAEYVPSIMNHPSYWKQGVLQIRDILYSAGFDKVQTEEYLWEKFIKPTVEFFMSNIKDKVANPDDADVLHAQLLQVDIKTGERLNIGLDSNAECLAVGVKNVNPDGTGKSPVMWLSGILDEDFNNPAKDIDWIGKKWSAYDIAEWLAYARGESLSNNWPNANEEYQINLDNIGKLPVFILGKGLALGGSYPEPIVSGMVEQTIPRYTNIISWMCGVKSRIVRVMYPSGSGLAHSEPAIFVNGKWFNFFVSDNLWKDYEGTGVNPDSKITDTSGSFVEFNP